MCCISFDTKDLLKEHNEVYHKQAVAEVVPSSCLSLDLALVRGGFKQTI